jgi:putative DNA primase/helicase
MTTTLLGAPLDTLAAVPAPDLVPSAEPVPRRARDSILLRADALAPERVDWLWRHHIALGKLTLIGGAPGTGKSTLALGLLAAVSSGGDWPCGEGKAPLGSAILVCDAAGVRDTIMPGLMAAGADRTRIGVISGVPGEGGRRPFNLHTDLAVIEDAIKELGEVRLVVIDPVNAFAGQDAAREDRLGALLYPLAALAEKHHVAVVVVAHPPKGNYLKPNVQAIGSVALNAAARTSFLLHNDPIDPRRRLLFQVKNSFAGDRGALSFTIERREVTPGVAGPVVVGDRRRSRITPDDVIGAGARTRSAKAEARAFLYELLGDKPSIPVKEIEAQARAAGLLSARQPLSQCKPLRDARMMLKLFVTREGFGTDGRWIWTKEDPTANREPKQTKPKKTRKEKDAERQARKLERQAAKKAERARARLEKLDPGASMEKRASMANAASMAEATSMPTVPVPAVAEGER